MKHPFIVCLVIFASCRDDEARAPVASPAEPENAIVAQHAHDHDAHAAPAEPENAIVAQHAHDHDAHDHDAQGAAATESHLNIAGTLAPRQPATLYILYHGMPTHALLTDLEPIPDGNPPHVHPVHISIESDDGDYHAHLHPEPGEAEGLWVIRHTFPAAGRYRVYSSFESRSRGANLTVSELIVPAGP